MRITGKLLGTEQPVTLVVDEGVIQHVLPPSEATDLGGPGIWLAPGFHDLQVNGYAGHDFNSGSWGLEDTAMDFSALQAALASHGTALLCPTVITDRLDVMTRNLQRLARYMDQDARFRRAVTGFHLEGPFLSPDEGPRGAHPVEHLRRPSTDIWQRLQDAADGRIAMVTLAPELPGALAFIERLVNDGVVVAIGHTGATPRIIRDAVSAGASVSTHLGNGCHAYLPRHDSYLWEQLACDALTATLIADGHHLDQAELKVFVRAKGVQRVALVSDAVRLAGMPPGLYAEGRFRVDPDGTIRLADTPYLAGASRLLDTGVAHAVEWTGMSLADAVGSVTEVPARVLRRRRKGRLEAGYDADITCFRVETHERNGDVELALGICATVTGGEIIYREHSG